jgi:hypothetical protein
MDVDRDQGLGTTIGTSSGPPPGGQLSKSPPGFLLQAVKVCLPSRQVGDGVKTVTSNDNQEYHAPQVMTPHPLMVSPLSVALPVNVHLPASASNQTGKSNIMPRFFSPGSSILHAPVQPRHILLNTKAFEAIQTPTALVETPRNLRPWSSGNGVTFASIAIFHKDPMVDPSINVYDCLKNVFELLLHADPQTTILTLYADKAGVMINPILTVSGYPTDVLGLGNYAQIINPYTLSKMVGKDTEGNQKTQRLTYVFMRILKNLLFSHAVGPIQPNLNQINVNVKENEMPYLDTKTQYAIVGTTNDWYSSALQVILTKELTQYIAQLQDGGYLAAEDQEKEVPPFMIRHAKLKLPQMDMLICKEDVEIINYFTHLQQCNVLEVADTDWIWMS